MDISCERCGKTFKKMDNLRRHLHRVNLCRPLLKDIPIEQLQQKYVCKKGIYQCENCGKVYKTSSGKCKHKKTCLPLGEKDKIIQKQEQIIDDNEKLLKEALNKILEAQQSREKLEQQVKELLQKQYVQNITNNNIIIINNFGEENTDYLQGDTNFLQNCIESPINSVQKYLDAVHFNKDHPENNNIKLTNLQSPYMDFFKNGNWNKVEQRVLIPNIIHKSVNVIHSLMSSIEEEEPEDQENIEPTNDSSIKWYQYRNQLQDSQLKEKIKRKTKSYIYNRSMT